MKDVYMYNYGFGGDLVVTFMKGGLDGKPRKVGNYKNRQDAQKAALTHYEKAAKMAEIAGREVPEFINC